MKEQLIIGKEQLETIKDSTLFYPCSGNDLLIPIELFSPYVTNFWFVDRTYFMKNSPADKQSAVLKDDIRYSIISKDIDGPPVWSESNRDITPCILTETYRHKQTDRLIRIHRRRGYGYSALRLEHKIGKLGVFFYRGDSQGEGGSGNHWLSKEHLDEVLAKLIDGGLLVLDGSDGTPYTRKSGIYKEICKYAYNTSISLTPKELIASMNIVTDHKKREYRCVGYAGMRYGPTMIWQVHGIAQQGASLDGDSAALHPRQ